MIKLTVGIYLKLMKYRMQDILYFPKKYIKIKKKKPN